MGNEEEGAKERETHETHETEETEETRETLVDAGVTPREAHESGHMHETLDSHQSLYTLKDDIFTAYFRPQYFFFALDSAGCSRYESPHFSLDLRDTGYILDCSRYGRFCVHNSQL